MTGFGITAVAVAPLAPDAASLPKRVISETLQPEGIAGQLAELATQDLRLTRSDGPAVRIERVTAETVQPGAPPEPFWFAANPAATADTEGFVFETGRLAPVQSARVELPSANMALHVALERKNAPVHATRATGLGQASPQTGRGSSVSLVTWLKTAS